MRVGRLPQAERSIKVPCTRPVIHQTCVSRRKHKSREGVDKSAVKQINPRGRASYEGGH